MSEAKIGVKITFTDSDGKEKYFGRGFLVDEYTDLESAYLSLALSFKAFYKNGKLKEIEDSMNFPKGGDTHKQFFKDELNY